MSDERDALVKNTDEDNEADVEAHKKVLAHEEKGSEDESETPDVEAHQKLKKHTL